MPFLRHSAFLWLSALVVSPAAWAQMHHVEAAQRVTRALGVYEWTGDLAKPTAARFVPISLFIDGHFEDAGLYLARPIPFALQPGDVYSLERAGEPAGLLDLDFARRVATGMAAADEVSAGTWYGFGKFTLETPPKVKPLHASGHLTAIQSSAGPNTPTGTKLPTADADDGRPHMSRRDAGTTSQTGSNTGSTTPESSKSSESSTKPTTSGSSPTTTASTGSSTDDDVDRPTLRKRDPSQDAARRREYGSKSKTSGVTAAGPALGDDPDRPTLSRGGAEAEGTPELTGLPADLHQAVAVSDANHTDAHVFSRDWDSPAERTETLAALAALAKPAMAAYLATNHLVPSALPIAQPAAAQTAAAQTAPAPATAGQASAPISASPLPSPTASPSPDSDTGAPPTLQRGIPKAYQKPAPTPPVSAASPTPAIAASPKPSTPSTIAPATHDATHPTSRVGHTGRTIATHPASLSLAQEAVSGFTLSYGGLPTFVYTAAASAAFRPASGSISGPTAIQKQPSTPAVAFVTVVAQRLASGELQVALINVTDSTHLDRGPRLRLVDAVDPDDSHRASLLFELRGASSRQFALYRLTAVHAEQTFTTASIE
ncbi:MAG: hypothetical protein ACRYFU_13090 [Janthinobacterium lividum]